MTVWLPRHVPYDDGRIHDPSIVDRCPLVQGHQPAYVPDIDDPRTLVGGGAWWSSVVLRPSGRDRCGQRQPYLTRR